MDMIPLQTVLELMSDEMWMNHIPRKESETGTDLPSLEERRQLVEAMLPKASFDGMIIRFDSQCSTLTRIPFFSYLLLSEAPACEDFSGGMGERDGTSWQITGFSSFDRLREYIVRTETSCLFIYVRHGSRYRQVQYRFAIQYPDREKTYVDAESFWPSRADEEDERSGAPLCRSFEIQGLCEMCCGDEIWTCIISSLDELGEELGVRAWKEKLGPIRKPEADAKYYYHEEGTVHYGGAVYSYLIDVNKDTIMWNFFDAAENPYCPYRHMFCTPDCRCCSGTEDGCGS